ncbi:hypothetical protein PHYBLDRAFT_175096 [Phycomyces blakesleeanus NRRL 1555(-)]|uniref:Uncharacterized protein n=1 Tax=Phycomyces blakesleeanus (strain ATCC 8743b / DSM 1359 / FGSC 10004 / NBRC 33097 / NRRL 1555) TaxID=763407 RepID=A0A162WED9_PHYB8|nr:hypothetical protein PHYBLDRAFT_175096 [Phycomyces blakesleeanus NRRL 1555(-)]OAD66545.1 hypothetical protein PHYBLDRAFT_175096 [Phycomyces blakesleeanus NRRL 1555(-)]|eukprot:XP_018284585.1 hypothetical protein PHYBLDRAFT_175096 [Phycomyces blakesleeanus NRRL 1555(-)]
MPSLSLRGNLLLIVFLDLAFYDIYFHSKTCSNLQSKWFDIKVKIQTQCESTDYFCFTTKRFYGEFGHNYNSMQKISRRYKSIIDNELKGVKNITNIRKEYSQWIKSKGNTRYWLHKIEKETLSTFHIEGAE